MFKFCDGFDHYAADGVKGATVQPYLEAAGYTVRNASDTTFAIAPGRRTGAHALQFSVARNSATNASLSWGYTPSGGYACFGFAMNASGSRMRICRIENVIDVDWDVTTGKVMVGAQLGVAALILNAWYYFEIEIDIANKVARIWANNELQLTVSLASTTLPTVYNIVWGQVGTAPDAGVQLLDDFYVIDGSGVNNVARLQPIEVTTRSPDTDITTEWSIVANGATPAPTNHYSIAAQLEPNAANKPYLQSNTAGATDLFRSNFALPTANQIFAVSVLAYARKGDLDERALGLLVQPEGGTESEVQLALSENFKYYQATYEKAPGGTDWSKNSVESLRFGIRTR
jgi:hypothetical protein